MKRYSFFLLVIVFSSYSFICRAATLVSTGSGSFSDSSIWTGGPPSTPTAPDNFIISDGTEVNAVSGDVLVANGVGGSSKVITVNGAWDINSGASFTNYSKVTLSDTLGAATVNINGGTLSSTILGGGAGSMTFNLTGGNLNLTGTVGGVSGIPTFNVSGGRFVTNFNTTAMAVNLSGTGVVDWANGGMTRDAIKSWNGGTNITNTNGGTTTATYLTLFTSHAANVWQLSSKTSKQTYTITSASLNQNITAGRLVFNIYSAANNDNDLISATGSNAKINFNSSVLFDIDGFNLAGVSSDYIGQSYRLLSYTGSYTGVNATIDPATWTIGGSNYDVTFINNLATNGSITVSALTLSSVPEPSAFALIVLSLGAFIIYSGAFRKRWSRS